MTSARVPVAVTVEQLWQPVPGGSGTYVRELVSGLARRGDIRVTGVASRHSEPPVGGPLPVPVARSPLPRRVLYDAWNLARRPRASVPTGSAVVHATTWAVPPRTAPLVVTVHDLAFLRSPEHFTARGNRFFRRALDIVRREADLIITPSQTTADDCTAAGISPQRLRVIPLAARTADVTPAQVAAFRTAHGVERPYVLWCGTLEPRKNLATLLAAFRRMREDHDEVDLVLVGPNGWGGVTVDASPDGRLHTLGRLSAEDLQVAYAGARAFAFPSTWEGFGLPVLEAMGHGIPVVTSVGTSMAEIGGDAALLVDPLDPEALAHALARAIGAEHGRLAARSKANAARFSWERTAELTAGVYRELA